VRAGERRMLATRPVNAGTETAYVLLEVDPVRRFGRSGGTVSGTASRTLPIVGP
jgi:hypothetical protein